MEKLTDIEKMAKILYRHYCGNATCGNCKQPRCVDYIRAEKLAKEGIGDVKQAVREFAEELKQASTLVALFNCCQGNDFVEVIKVEDLNRILRRCEDIG
ncbi:MAG: hypothetical protein K2L70_04500 [Clostridia bacterium]|nr:hypothetical protein [Clostridia bacterium]